MKGDPMSLPRSRLTLELLESREVPSTLHGDLVLGPDDSFGVSLTYKDANPHHRLNVNGEVQIDDAAINIVAVGKHTRPGDEFIIIANNGTDPVAGAFAGLEEGSLVTAPGGTRYRISYEGGDGNDVSLTRINVPPTFINRTLTNIATEGGKVTLSGQIVDPDPLDFFFLTVDWGDGVMERFKYGPGAGGTTVSLTHVYADNADAYKVNISWSDKLDFGNAVTMETKVVNVAPTIDQNIDIIVGAGRTLRQIVSFTDPGADQWTATVDWGDETSRETIVIDDGKLSFTISHQYKLPGTYHVIVQVADDDGDAHEMTFKVTVI
jgi:hypothetical protein